MILVKSRLIFGLIKTIFSLAFKIVYKIIKWFRLIFAVLVFVAGVILHYTGVLADYPYIKIILAVLMVLALIYPIYALIRKLTKKGKGRGEENSQTIIDSEGKTYQAENSYKPYQVEQSYKPNNPYQVGQNYQPELNKQEQNSSIQYSGSSDPTFIGYFKVKQNPNYLMAEYTDRYELFLKTETGLKKVRVDYKQ